MAKYRIRVEIIEGGEDDTNLGDLTSRDGYVCEGFILMGNQKDERSGTTFVQNVSPMDIALMFAGDEMLIASAKAGEALSKICTTRAKSNVRDRMRSLSEMLAGLTE